MGWHNPSGLRPQCFSVVEWSAGSGVRPIQAVPEMLPRALYSLVSRVQLGIGTAYGLVSNAIDTL